MALRKAKPTVYGFDADYWRIVRLSLKKHGGDGVNISAEIGLYLDHAASDTGRGAFETRDIVLPEPLPVWQEPDAVYPVSVDQVRYALGILLTYIYEQVQTGAYEGGEENNYFQDAERA